MTRLLLIVAGGGLGLCLLLLAVAAAFNGGSLNFGHTDISFVDQPPLTQTATSKSWTLDGDEIEIGIPARVRYQPGGKPMITVTASPDMIKRVSYGDGKLGRSMPHFFGSDEPVDVTVTGTLEKITVAGSGKVDLGQIHQQRLELAIDGSGSVDGGGAIDDLSLSIAGSGRMRLGELVAKKLNVSIAGSGSIDTAASDTADVSIAGSGTVRFHVQPKHLSQHIAGSGNIVYASGEKD